MASLPQEKPYAKINNGSAGTNQKKQEGRTENAKQTKKNNLGGNHRKEHLAGAQAPDLAPESPAPKTQPEPLPLFLGSGHQEQEPEEPDPKTTTPRNRSKKNSYNIIILAT
jgi:hypothetical protein